MKKIYNFLTSMKLMLFLTIIFAIACAEATFIENDYGTPTAWAEVYGTKWFEWLQILLGINLLGNIFKFKMYRKEKLPAFIFHIGFLFILVGAGITRYIGYEGLLHIREGASKNSITTLNSYIQMEANKNGKLYQKDKKILISKISDNYFKVDMDIDGKKATLEYKKLIPNVEKKLIKDKTSSAKIKMMVATPNNPPKVIVLDQKDFNFSNGIKFFVKDDKVYIKSNKEFTTTKMADATTTAHKAGEEIELKTKRMYNFGDIKLTPIKVYAHAKEALVSKKVAGGKNVQSNFKSAIKATLSYDGVKKNIVLFGYGDSRHGDLTKVDINGTKFVIEWGAKEIPIPFSVKLDKFELKRYPGSNSPASYASYVTVKDKDKKFDYKIYMNHVLDYKGYRLFQSSYDMDEKGTVLSVNHDPGKLPTYIGYFLLGLGFILNFLNPKSRFRKLAHRVQKDTIAYALVAISLVHLAQPLSANSLDEAKLYDKHHSELFGDLLLQKQDGRVVSLDSFSKELLLKLTKKTSIYGLDSNQIILGMITAPKVWQDIPIIRVKHDKIKKLLGLPKSAKYAAYKDFFDFSVKRGSPYKLLKDLEIANQKRPIQRNQFDRSLIKVDERLNIAYMIYTGDLLRIIPKENDPNFKWYSVKDAISSFPPEEANRVKTLFLYYFSQVDKAKKTGNWESANKAVRLIKSYQEKLGAAVIPPKSQIEAEKIFAKLRLFDKLAFVYFIGGLILLITIFYKMIKSSANIKVAKFIGESIIIFAFLAHTIGMGIRWYIAGHAPWSNAYEAMLYIAWSMGLAGVVFRKYSLLAPALTAIIAGSTLFTTFLAGMDPQITNLVPVLNSYWLDIHVSVLTASYGFLALSMILGFFTLIMFMFKDKNPDVKRSIIEASRINEMTAILGLALLTIGNFLGGVWANESWGRYWGWDPKETWAWISILVYVILTHIRFVPWFNKDYHYKFAALSLVSYASIIMTFVGVNYYLSGMHSYAAGDPMPIPKYLYLIVAIVIGVIIAAYPKRHLEK